jgi:hypothetical protein
MRAFITVIFRFILKEKDELSTAEIFQLSAIVFNTWFGYFSAYAFLIFFL